MSKHPPKEGAGKAIKPPRPLPAQEHSVKIKEPVGA